MRLQHLQGRARKGYTTFGGVWEKGEVTSLDFKLQDDKGNAIPVQSKAMAWWADGSVKWSAHTADALMMTEEIELIYGGNNAQNVSLDSLKGGKRGQVSVALCREACTINEIRIEETIECYHVNTGKLSLELPKRKSDYLARRLMRNGKEIASRVYPVFVWETREEKGYSRRIESKEFQGEITSVELEEQGALQMVVCFRGNHIPVQSDVPRMPFVIRMYLWADSDELRFQHTLLYDGEEERDYLKGMGICFDVNMSPKKYDRHIQFGTDKKHFHEAAVMLASNSPKLSPEIFKKQLMGEFVEYDADSLVEQVVSDIPLWNDYSICQDSAYHYAIRKRTQEGCCDLTCLEGKRGQGTMAIHSKYGGLLLGIRDFWQKYPSGLEVRDLGEATTTATIWFYSPQVQGFDFRHYSKKSYPRTCYEGFDYVGATAYGIGVTSEARVQITDCFVGEEELQEFSERVQTPAIYVGEPQYYHDKRAFGYWSLMSRETEVECWLEEQMDKAFAFYKQEIEARDWYGLFDYGDVMHTYDAIRHVWRYDFGGMAWQNTELVPTYWLWLYFLRTGREDVFTMIEAMSRHCSEVDSYHFGPLKGLGSRHNVRHWGCSCKEPRIAMAGHTEYYEISIEQAFLMERKTLDTKTGLWYHAYDETRTAEWADKDTGCSSEFWGRSLGWVPVAILEELEYIPQNHPDYQKLRRLVKDLIIAICRYQSKDGRWYQVVNKGEEPRNWLENSCSCLYVAAIAKAVRMGILDASYWQQAVKGYAGVIKSLSWDGEDLQIGNVCIGTGVGDFTYYCERPTSENDLHGVGAFLLMCTEVARCELK